MNDKPTTITIRDLNTGTVTVKPLAGCAVPAHIAEKYKGRSRVYVIAQAMKWHAEQRDARNARRRAARKAAKKS